MNDQEFSGWVRSRPVVVQNLMRSFPPGARVRARKGVALMVPAPGVIGDVVSWFENGTVGIIAPLAVTVRSPSSGDVLGEGQLLKAQCWPRTLEVVSFGVIDDTEISGDLIASILDEDDAQAD